MHHDFRSAEEGKGVQRIKLKAWDQGGHHPHMAVPVLPGAVHGHFHSQIEPSPPLLNLSAVDQVSRAPLSIQQDHPPVLSPVGQDMVQNRPQGGHPDSPGYQQDVMADQVVDGPGTAKGAADAQAVSGLQGSHAIGDRAVGPYGMDDLFRFPGISADGNGDLPSPCHVKHVELTGFEEKPRTVRRRGQFQGKGIPGLLLYPLYHMGCGQRRMGRGLYPCHGLRSLLREVQNLKCGRMQPIHHHL